MAMPMSALLSAGASLTPSPVTATICRFRFSAPTIRIFWSAPTRAKITSGVIQGQLELRVGQPVELVAR